MELSVSVVWHVFKASGQIAAFSGEFAPKRMAEGRRRLALAKGMSIRDRSGGILA